jgi:hypothetical protein
MHAHNQMIASLTLYLGAGTLILAGSICALSSQIQTLISFLKGRGRQRQSS